MHIGNWTRWIIGAVVAIGLPSTVAASATGAPAASEMAGMDMHSSVAAHDMSMHDKSMDGTMSTGLAISTWHSYSVPKLTLINQHGVPVSLDNVLSGEKPVLVQFFYASCTTICGVRSAQLVAMAKSLVKADIHLDIYTITTDPDRDTPSRLLSYSKEFGPPPANWQLMTGTLQETKQVQAAFDASDPADNRMLHQPETFIRAGNDKQWLRIDGMTTTAELEQQVKMVVASSR